MIKEAARELGFLDCGVVPAGYLSGDSERLHRWLDAGYQGTMTFMERHFDKRCDPRLLVENARSIIVVFQNYYTARVQSDPDAPVLSKYAYGPDYHRFMKRKLGQLLVRVQKISGSASGRVFVDSAPLLERALGRLAGLGWIGKNSMLLSRNHGSFFFIGSVVTDVVLKYDKPVNEYCGNCTKCIDACPTKAIVAPGIVDATKCISYQTIENRGGVIPPEMKPRFMNRVFGCDICQDVCPWNKNATEHDEPGLRANDELLMLSKKDWYSMNEETYNRIFSGSAVKRATFAGLRRNLDFLK